MRVKIERIIEVPEGKYCEFTPKGKRFTKFCRFFDENCKCLIYGKRPSLETEDILKLPECLKAEVVKDKDND
jgi:hypothetical protein